MTVLVTFLCFVKKISKEIFHKALTTNVHSEDIFMDTVMHGYSDHCHLRLAIPFNIEMLREHKHTHRQKQAYNNCMSVLSISARNLKFIEVC